MSLEEKEAYNEEVFTKRWLYISLLCVLTFGFIQIVLFLALIFCFVIYTLSYLMMESAEHEE